MWENISLLNMVKVGRKKTAKEAKAAPRRGSFTRERPPSRKGEKKRAKAARGGAAARSKHPLRKVSKENVFDKLDGSDEIDGEGDEIVDVSTASESEDETGGEAKAASSAKDERDVIVLDDSDGDASDASNASEVVEIVDSESDSEEEPPLKRRKLSVSEPAEPAAETDLDYIAFDMESEPDDEDDMADYDAGYDVEGGGVGADSAYLSDDASGSGSYRPASSSHPAASANPNFPWIRNNDHTRQKSMADWLTTEITDFVRYISPSADEIRARNELIQNLRRHISGMWPDAELLCFGSYATDLYLPGSDIDCVVVTKRGPPRYDTKNALYKLTSYIRSHGLGIEVVPIAKAKVPIIKFVDPRTRIHIDVSFERTNGLTAAKLIIEWIRTTPGLRELVLVVKQFLASRRLNEVHTGGLGGFAIICLVYAFLKLHPRLATSSIDPLENLGVLLIEFLELYGYNFGYDNVALAFTTPAPGSKTPPQPMYIPKSANASLLNRSMFALSIQDPHDPLNNITRGTYNLRDIKRAFGGAFELLVNQCYTLQGSPFKDRLGQSILGGIIKWKGRRRSFGDARAEVSNLAMTEVQDEKKKDKKDKKDKKKDKKDKKDKKKDKDKSKTDKDKTDKPKSDKKSKKEKKKSPPLNANGMPMLPTEKAGIDVDLVELSDSYVSMSEEDHHSADIVTRFEDSQKSTRTTAQTEKELLGIDSASDSDGYEPARPAGPQSTPAPVDPLTASAAAVAKSRRREYWDQKSGKTF